MNPLYKTFEDLSNGAIQRGLLGSVKDAHLLFCALQDLQYLIELRDRLQKRVDELEREKEDAQLMS